MERFLSVHDSLALWYQRIKLVFTFSNLYSWFCIDTSERNHMLIFVTLSFQVETVGDKYMAVSGLPTRCSRHAVNIANLALDMIDIVQEVNARGKKMQVYSSCCSLIGKQPRRGVGGRWRMSVRQEFFAESLQCFDITLHPRTSRTGALN